MKKAMSFHEPPLITFLSFSSSLASNRLKAKSRQKPFYFRLNSKVGEFFNGDIYTYGLSLNYRIVPHVNMDFSYSNNKIKLPYASSNLASYSTKVEVSFNTKLFLTTFFHDQNYVPLGQK